MNTILEYRCGCDHEPDQRPYLGSVVRNDAGVLELLAKRPRHRAERNRVARRAEPVSSETRNGITVSVIGVAHQVNARWALTDADGVALDYGTSVAEFGCIKHGSFARPYLHVLADVHRRLTAGGPDAVLLDASDIPPWSPSRK